MRKRFWLLIPLGVLIALPLTCVLGLFGLRASMKKQERASWLERIEQVAQSSDGTLYNPHPDYLDELLNHRQAAGNVRTIHFSDDLHDPSIDWSKLKQLPALNKFYLYSTSSGTDAFIATFEGSETIESIVFDGAGVTNAGIESLARYPQLKGVFIRTCRPLSLTPLRESNSLVSLTLDCVPITKENLEILPDLPNLQDVTWHGEHYSSPLREQLESVEGFDCQIVGEYADGFRATLTREDASGSKAE